MNNLTTIFEIYISTSSEDMKGDTSVDIWGGLEYLGATQGHWKWHNSTELLRVPISLQL